MNYSRLKHALLIMILFLLLFESFQFKVYKIRGDSMTPSLIEGDFVLIKRIKNTNRFNRRNSKYDLASNSPQIQKHDICIFNHPNSTENCIKRCMGIEKDTVIIYDQIYDDYFFSQLVRTSKDTNQQRDYSDQMKLLSTKKLVVEKDYYYFKGDNINLSYDSRHFGLIKGQDIIGKAQHIIFSCKDGKFRWDRLVKEIK